MPSEPRFAFFGTPYVARDTLAILIERCFTPAVVITSPDAPRGRGQVMTPCETKVLAQIHNLPVLTPEKLDDATMEQIKSYGCEYAIVVAYGKLFPLPLIESFPKGVLNIHYSLLPQYRGASPVESALLNGETVTGVAIQQMALEMDAGDIFAVKEVSIEPAETTRELRPRLVTIGANLLADMLPKYLAGEITPTPQDHSQATRARKIKKEEGELDLAGDPDLNWRKYRAFAESPGTYFFTERDGKQMRVKIKSAEYKNRMFTPLSVVPEGKNEMAYADFVRA